jgi:hypothetical protein
MKRIFGSRSFRLAIAASAVMTLATPASERPTQGSLSKIDRVWSGHRVNFAVSRAADRIFVAYYDAERQLTVASRTLADAQWTRRKLDVRTGWDSHNYIAMAVDSGGFLHLSGNMHNDPLVYFRSDLPGDIATLTRIPVLVDARVEQRMTYPVFLFDRDRRLVLKYRDGGSGNGNEIYDVYDVAAKRWNHLLTSPLVDGEGSRNAYFVGPVLGPDGYFHLAWVWRETPDAETNHDLSYARSRDLVQWEKSDGSPYSLPIRLANAEIVDAVPVEGGMINNNTVVGFDSDGRPMITYHRFDARGDTQIFVARRESTGWKNRAITQWRDFRWDFRGRGSLVSRLTVSGAAPAPGGRLHVGVRRDGLPIDILLDEDSLKPASERAGTTLAQRLAPVIPVPAGMELNAIDEPSGFAIAWASRPPNRDRPTSDIPAPTELFLVSPASKH